MNVRELREALQALGPEYDESMVLVAEPGMSGPGEAKRLITIPKMTDVDLRMSWEVFERVVWIDTGGEHVSKGAAEQEGWRVPYYNPVLREPSPLTRTPKQQYEDTLRAELAKRHVACPTCLAEWQRGRCVPKGLVRIITGVAEFCCHCGAFCEPAATTPQGKERCTEDHSTMFPDQVSLVSEEP
jgi:hypothetical protein